MLSTECVQVLVSVLLRHETQLAWVKGYDLAWVKGHDPIVIITLGYIVHRTLTMLHVVYGHQIWEFAI